MTIEAWGLVDEKEEEDEEEDKQDSLPQEAGRSFCSTSSLIKSLFVILEGKKKAMIDVCVRVFLTL